jgi:hypothetical protein
MIFYKLMLVNKVAVRLNNVIKCFFVGGFGVIMYGIEGLCIRCPDDYITNGSRGSARICHPDNKFRDIVWKWQ